MNIPEDVQKLLLRLNYNLSSSTVWWEARNYHFQNKTPSEVYKTEGPEAVTGYLVSRLYGEFF